MGVGGGVGGAGVGAGAGDPQRATARPAGAVDVADAIREGLMVSGWVIGEAAALDARRH